MTVIVNTAGLIAALNAMSGRVAAATAVGARDGALVYERFIKEEIQGGHAKNVPTGAVPGGPPQNVTGNLRRSVGVGRVVGTGFRYEVEIGPSADYGQYLEGGTSKMRPHPFVRPAAEKAEASGLVEVAVVGAWRAAIGI